MGYGGLPTRKNTAANFGILFQETMNFWKQTAHVMSYFPEENFRGHERLPKNFMGGFLEVSTMSFYVLSHQMLTISP